MRRLDILEYPDPRLRLPSRRVTTFDENLVRLIEDMIETLRLTKAIALSAPQVDDRRAVLVMDLSGDGSAPQAFVNPEILSKGAWGLVEESCLSLPGVVGNVVRATAVRVRAQDRQGSTFERDLAGMEAVCLQHEMDHLVGKLFVDRLSLLQKLRFHAFAGKRARRRSTAA
ncbi:peptide deformylase [Algihabitans albus]|uniref:peptide deformylase n=1 Tax=Algihabitans albus TaxID=2164067 RepID=UPI000E5D2901|nr:peptide deformylase [Algihabitans albus]